MRLAYVVTLGMLLSLTVSTDGSAQGRTIVISRGGVRGGTMRGAPTPQPDKIGDVSKVALRSIKLAKEQNESVKSLNKQYEAEEKELIRLAAMVGRGSRGSRVGGPGGRGGSRAGGPPPPASGGENPAAGGGTTIVPQLSDALFDLHAKFVAAVREVLTEEQRPILDANLEEHERKIQEALDKAALRGRGH